MRRPHPASQGSEAADPRDLTAKMQLTGVRIEREAISKIESGERFVADYELVNFARVLGVTMEWLVGEE